MVAATLKNKGEVYAALYELNGLELIPALEAFGKNCSLKRSLSNWPRCCARQRFSSPCNVATLLVSALIYKICSSTVSLAKCDPRWIKTSFSLGLANRLINPNVSCPN
jgi:hypothetical protein